MDSEPPSLKEKLSILMFPWLAHGHISPFLELAKSLSKRNFHIYFCSTLVNLDSIKTKLPSSSRSNIQLVEHHLPFSNELPPHLHTAKGLPSHLIPSLKKAFSMASHDFYTILQALKPDLIIYDYNQPWAPQIASSLNIPAVNYFNNGALVICGALHDFQNPGSQFPFPDALLRNNTTIVHGASSETIRKEGEILMPCLFGSRDVVFFNTFREIDGKYLDYISLLSNKKIVPIGPLIHEPNDQDEDEHHYYSSIINWLDKKKPSSTVFVSFGTECFLSEEEMEEIASGLEMSKANFIWVIRFHQGDSRISTAIEENLPEGFMERMKKEDRGMVVRDWAPQTKILKHRNTGGFLSHCGWNSVLESMVFGVPIVALPMNMDQPFNARLVELVGMGVEAKRDVKGKIQREEVAKLIKEMVVEKTRENVRKKAREMSELLSRKSREEKMDELVAEIYPLMGKL